MKRVSRATGLLAIATLSLAALAGCRGGKSTEPPFHLVPDMDWQPKYQAQQAAPLFENGQVMQPIIHGTIAQETPPEEADLDKGPDGNFVARVPMDVTAKLLERGQDRFNIYCTPCHDKTGSGRGMAVQRGFPPPVNLTSDRVRTMRDGEIFHVITNGVRNMPSYAHQVPIADRWAIITWIRVLQHSQTATIADVPVEQRSHIEKESTQ